MKHKTVRKLLRYNGVRDKDISKMAADILGRRVQPATVSSWVSGWNRWPLQVVVELLSMLKKRDVSIELTELVKLCNMTRDEILEAEGRL